MWWKIRCFVIRNWRKITHKQNPNNIKYNSKCERCGQPIECHTDSIANIECEYYYTCEFCGFVRSWAYGSYAPEDTEHGRWQENSWYGKALSKIHYVFVGQWVIKYRRYKLKQKFSNTQDFPQF